MGDILDRWIAKVEDALIAGGEDEDADDFDQKVRKRIDEDLAALTGGKAPQDFVRVTQTIFDLKQVGNLVDAGSLISWLCGSGNVAANPKKLAGVSYSVIYRPSIAIANSKRKFRINATTKHETRRLESPIPRPVGSSIVILVSTSTPSSHV